MGFFGKTGGKNGERLDVKGAIPDMARILWERRTAFVLFKTRKKWRAKMRGWKDQLFRTEGGPVNLYAQERAEDSEEAMGVAASGDVHFAKYTNVIICHDTNQGRLDETVSLVIKTIRNLGFGCRGENSEFSIPTVSIATLKKACESISIVWRDSAEQ